MLGHNENFSTTGENSNNVGIWVSLSSSSHVLLCTKKLVKTFDFGVFVDKYDLPTILDHAMSSIAEKGKDNFMGVAFESSAQANRHTITVFYLGLQQS